KNSGQCSLIEAMSPMPVPTSSQTVAHTTYSNSTRTVAASTDGVATRPGSRIRVRIADSPIVIAPHSCSRLPSPGRPSPGAVTARYCTYAAAITALDHISHDASLAGDIVKPPPWQSYSDLKRRLSIFSALIFDSRVDEGTPSRAAAPKGPDTRPLLSLSAVSMTCFS